MGSRRRGPAEDRAGPLARSDRGSPPRPCSGSRARDPGPGPPRALHEVRLARPLKPQRLGSLDLELEELGAIPVSLMSPGDGPVIPLPGLLLAAHLGLDHGEEEPVIAVAFSPAAKLHGLL